MWQWYLPVTGVTLPLFLPKTVEMWPWSLFVTAVMWPCCHVTMISTRITDVMWRLQWARTVLIVERGIPPKERLRQQDLYRSVSSSELWDQICWPAISRYNDDRNKHSYRIERKKYFKLNRFWSFQWYHREIGTMYNVSFTLIPSQREILFIHVWTRPHIPV
jgi:hypothetical protein